jgi:hypothetical protein
MKKTSNNFIIVITLSCLLLTAGPCIVVTGMIQNAGTQTSKPSPPTAVMKEKGLVDYWSFDEGSGNVVYDSVGGNDGQINECNWVPGHAGTALEFPSFNSWIGLPGSFDNQIRYFVSIDAWIYWYGHGSFPYSHIIFDTRRGGFTGGYVFFVWPDGTLRFYNDFKPEQHVISKTKIPIDEWTHVRVEFNALTNKMKLFINDKLDATARTSYPLRSNDYGALIGNNVYVEPAPFNGIIDELKIYNSRPNPYNLVLMGQITDKTTVNSTITFNAKSLIVWDKDASTFSRLKSGEQIVVSTGYKGFIGTNRVIGRFDGYVKS